MTIIVEQRLVFDFGPSWQVTKYDEHPIYHKGIARLKGSLFCDEKNCGGEILCERCRAKSGIGTKSVDILGRHEGQVYFIEIKDFRGYRIENKKRLRDGDLAVEVAVKIRDTLAGLAGTLDGGGAPVWEPWAAPIFKKPPKIVLWLEEDGGSGAPGDERQRASVLEDKLKERLCWLSAHVSVKNQRLSRRLPELAVSNLSNRVYDVRTIVKKNKGNISFEEFRGAWAASPQTAGELLKKLCDQGSLRRVAGKSDQFAPGLTWEQFHDEPA